MKGKNREQTSWQEFLDHCLQCNNEAELSTFFELCLTISEREEIPKRLQIIKELVKGEATQREIASKLKVSIANITRASNMLKAVDYDLNDLLHLKSEAK